ncbi:MAG: hypothetical protein ACI33S_04250, partial [Bacilli bacterium]
GGTSSTTATYDSAMPALTSLPTRIGYTFSGYYSETNGEGTKYYNADGTSARTWNIASNRILYAKWKVLDVTPPTCTISGESTTWTTGSRTITYGCNDANGCKSGKSGGTKTFTGTTKTATIPAYTIEDNYGNVTNCPAKVVNVYVATSIINRVINCFRTTMENVNPDYKIVACANSAVCTGCDRSQHLIDPATGHVCCKNWWNTYVDGFCYKYEPVTVYEYGVSSCSSGYTQDGGSYCPSGYTEFGTDKCYK